LKRDRHEPRAAFVLIDAGELLQHVSRVVYRGSPLYYGRSSTNRYDDPAQAYGVLYLGRDLPTALMESVFHKHQWLADTKRSIALKEVQSRMVRAVGVMDDVLLADLTAPGVMAGYFGLNLEQLASRDYTHTQQVSAQVHAMLGDDGQVLFDGVLYPSRNNYPARASRCSSVPARRSVSSRTSIWLTMWTGRVSLLPTASAWSPTLARWNRMTKRPEAAREHIEALNRMKWTKLK
jgi:hypothetical protein